MNNCPIALDEAGMKLFVKQSKRSLDAHNDFMLYDDTDRKKIKSL